MSDIVYKKNVFSTPFLSGYNELKIPIMDSTGKPAWPELFPIEKIDQIRETVGDRYFSAQMMLNYIPPDKIRLDPGGIKIYESDFDIRHARIDGHQITGGAIYWDPSGGRRNGDNSVCALIYRDDNNRIVLIHDILYITVPDDTEYPLAYQCECVLEFVKKHHFRTLSLETNGIGNALPEIMRNTISRTGYGIQIRPINNSRRKEDRIIDAMEPLLTTGRLFAHTQISRTPFFSEMLAWTPIGGAEHDDGLDAVSGAIACVPIPIRPYGTTVPRYTANTNFNL